MPAYQVPAANLLYLNMPTFLRQVFFENPAGRCEGAMGRAMSEGFTVGGICRRFVGAMCEEFTGRDVREICGGDVRGDVQGVVQAKYRFRSRENIFTARKSLPLAQKIFFYRHDRVSVLLFRDRKRRALLLLWKAGEARSPASGTVRYRSAEVRLVQAGTKKEKPEENKHLIVFICFRIKYIFIGNITILSAMVV